ncbi:ubiquitin carboxyl-terminal hydrolase 47 isoform X3 [Polypterus senegalus]|uniref:ubiquitin carboxyl-terminal hydrolase 47 isoform X3 n=1 Tax=Polypterus senegalus TaxID=55291 RepID=UPI001962E97B|nr:ubiquitin carboxyl-terminal hydrolase 47 isoform X3 [Polypterus senegalus]
MWLFHLLWACSAFSLPRLAVVLVLLLLLLLLSVAPVLLSSYFCKRLAMASRRDKTKRDKASADSSSPPGFRGLYNQGSTCYLNTVLQTLFMTPAFRHAIYRLGANCSDTKPIILELKKLFEELQFGKQSVSTRGITKSLGITDVWVQRDAEEYFQKILTQVGGEILEIYQSCVLSITTCGRCQTSQQESNTYLSIPLALNPGIAGCYSVENGLEQFLITEHLRGENQIYCDNCEVKTDAEIKLCFQCMPKILTLQLKRFEFDWIQMCHVKNQRAVEIPEILKFTQDGTVWSFKKDSAQNSVVYELFAIFHHSGGYRGGHYTADVRLHETEDWYSFDDSCVYLQNNKKTKHKQRSHTAYVLMYRRGDTGYLISDKTRFSEILQTEDIPIDESSGITNNSQNSKKKKTESPPFTQGNNGDIEHERKKSELNRNDTEDCAALKKHQELSSSSVASQLLNRTEDGDFSKSNSAGFVKDMENLNLEQSSSGMSETRTPPRVDLVDPLAETMGNKEAAQRSEEASDGHHDNASIENTDIGKCAL